MLATGYNALTGALTAIDIRGENGRKLSEKWAPGPINYLGLMTEPFANLYVVTRFGRAHASRPAGNENDLAQKPRHRVIALPIFATPLPGRPIVWVTFHTNKY